MFNSDVKLPEGICHILNRNVQEKTSSSKELYFADGAVRKIRSWRIFPDHQRKTTGFLYIITSWKMSWGYGINVITRKHDFCA